MGAVVDRWLANAGSVAVLCFALALVALGAGHPWLANALLALAAAGTVQGLRNLWHQSRPRAVLLALVFPLLISGLLVFDGLYAASLLPFAPAALAVLAELAVRRWRVARGLPAVAPAAAVAARPVVPPLRRVAVGCAVLLGLGVAGMALLSFAMSQPARHARAFHGGLRAGMTLADVAITAWPHGTWYGFVNAGDGAPPVALTVGVARVGGETARGEAEVRSLLDRHAPTLGLVSASFSFRGMVPTRAVVTVHFGPDGRVVRIDEPRTFAD